MAHTGVTVAHSQPRSFPLWFEHGFITNLDPDRGQRAWARDSLHMELDGRIEWIPVDLDIKVHEHAITVAQARGQIIDLLDQAVQELGDQPVRLFCSGGLDTFLIYALLKKHNKQLDLVEQDHFETTPFIEKNRSALEKYWSYQKHQLNHWNQPTWLATGGCGDEYFLRGPAVIAMLTAWHDIDFESLLQQHQDQYHYHHFSKYQELWKVSWQTREDLRTTYDSRELLMDQIMDNLANDHQHWHLGHTLTWTPLKNINIARILLQCDIGDLLPQFLHGQITRDIIAHYCEPVLDFVSTYKNHNNKQHLQRFLDWHHHA